MKHTKGPWRYKPYARLDYIEHQVDIGGIILGHDDLTEADARLLAAAPELLKALKGLVFEIEDMAIFDDSGRWEGILKRIKETIRKAEGGDK